MKRPSIKSPCVADRYAIGCERIAEFMTPSGKGGLIRVSETDGAATVEVYRCDEGVNVIAPLPDNRRDDANDTLVLQERHRIAKALDDEADSTPCAEDAMVTRSNARLVRANFSYEGAEQIEDKEDDSANDTLDALVQAESFITGFEGDELQEEPVDDMLAGLRTAIAREQAAPDMLAALKALLAWGREHTSPRDENSPHELLIAAAAAVAKAEG